jgi:hypothetical protein
MRFADLNNIIVAAQFSLSPSFVGQLHSNIKKQIIPGLSKELSRVYGEIYHKVTKSNICNEVPKIFHLQSNSVITNSSGPAIFVRYNRAHLCTKMTNLPEDSVRYNRVFV